MPWRMVTSWERRRGEVKKLSAVPRMACRREAAPYPVGIDFHFNLPLGRSSSGAFQCPDPVHHEVGDMLRDHVREMPLAGNYCLLKTAFHFEEHRESVRKGEHVHCHSHASWIRSENIGILQVTSGFMQVFHSSQKLNCQVKGEWQHWISQFSAICMDWRRCGGEGF